MKNYLKLLNFEFNRIAKFYFILVALVLILQLIGVYTASTRFMDVVNETMKVERLTVAQYIDANGGFSFGDIFTSAWFFGPVAISIAGIGFYIFLIWYRDWFGKNTFIYRLLMLPTTRLNIFYAKLTLILIATLGLVACQLIFFPVEMWFMGKLIPSNLIEPMTVKELILFAPPFAILMPGYLIGFILHYGAGVICVSVIFTAILIERSYKWKGIFGGMIYSVIMFALFLLPIVLQKTVLKGYLYPIEVLIAEMIAGVIIFAISIYVSGFLLKKKITV